jgi:hypothetical protein
MPPLPPTIFEDDMECTLRFSPTASVENDMPPPLPRLDPAASLKTEDDTPPPLLRLSPAGSVEDDIPPPLPRFSPYLRSPRWVEDTSRQDILSLKILGQLRDPSVTEINMTLQGLDDTFIVNLADALRLNSTLTHINMSHNIMGDMGALALSDSVRYVPLRTFASLPIFTFDRLHFMVYLHVFFSGHIGLQTIDASHNCIGDIGCKSLLSLFRYSIQLCEHVYSCARPYYWLVNVHVTVVMQH